MQYAAVGLACRQVYEGIVLINGWCRRFQLTVGGATSD